MEDEVRVISGTRRQIRELVDGSLEVRIHIDPRFKSDFHRLFPSIDMPCALAPLVANFERIEEEEKQKGGPLCKLAAMWCKDKDFHEWLAFQFDADADDMDEEEAAQLLKDWVGIKSRKELDHDPVAAERFQKMVRAPFMEWRKNK